ncbi:THUMP domain-containing protein 2 isoform X1 [Brachyistius frenatus]|uniref:THUMP domain-containing protein 2 isoform X1 n=1 Tax=Brachyistius frenatus TaxID=100188 RepID=UPI0037E74BEE
MAEPRSEGSVVRYFCTAGNGMEPFLIDEVKRKLAAEDVSVSRVQNYVCQMPGKVLFSSSATINRVRELKAAERLFLLLKQDSPFRLSAHTNPAKAASELQTKLLGARDQWTSAVMTWSRLQEELKSSRTPSTALALKMKREEGGRSEEQRREGEKSPVESRKSTDEQREEESGNGRPRSVKQNGTQTLEKKRKRDSEEEQEERKGADRDSCFMKDAATTPGLKHNVESSSSSRMDDITEDFAVESVENVKTTGDGDKTLPKACRNHPECSLVSFRISCKCTGSLSRCFGTQEVSRVLGAGLSRLLGWKADLKNPQLEVNVYLSDDHCLLGFPLTRLPLANRSYIKTTGLRSTVAWAMASLAQIQPGFCVVDPMCGVGIILMEAAQENKAACFLGIDNDDGQLQRANENMAFAELGNRIDLLKASSMALPLPSASADAVICDLPFGRKFGSRINMAANLPLILTEMERVLRIGGSLVLLLSPQLSCILKKLLTQKDPGPPSNPETKAQTGTENCPSPCVSPTEEQTFQKHSRVKSSSTQETEPQTEPQRSPPHTLSSLKHQATLRVSLGAIDGLIHKYVKTDASSVLI